METVGWPDLGEFLANKFKHLFAILHPGPDHILASLQGDPLMSKRRFKHWAYLNPEGMEEWGHIFPDRKVPVLSMIWKTGEVGEPGNVIDFFTVQWDELTDVQKDNILGMLSDKFKVSILEIEKQRMKVGMSLRRSLTNGSGTNHPGLFI